jgi:predicted nucleic acid-binding protein
VTIIPDASVIVPLLLNEENSTICQEIIEGSLKRIHLDFTLIEVSNSLRSAVARGRISLHRSKTAFDELNMICDHPIRSSVYLENALSLALQINHSVYDCLYAIAARANNATLVTCDAKFAAKLDNAIYSVKVV